MAPTGKPTHAVFFFLLYSLSTLIRPTSANCYNADGTNHNAAVNASYPGSADEYYAPVTPMLKPACAVQSVQVSRATPTFALAMGYASTRVVLGGEEAAQARVGAIQLA